MTAPVGSAYLMARVVTTKVKSDLKKAFDGAWRDVKADSERQGYLAAKRFQRGFKAGLADAKLTNAMAGAWRDVKKEAQSQGQKAGQEYARAFNRAAQQGRRTTTPGSRTTDGGGGGGGGAGGGGGRVGAGGAGSSRSSFSRQVLLIETKLDDRATGVFQSALTAIKASLKGIAVLSAAATAAFAGQAALSGIMGIIGGLSQMSGLLLTIPALVNAVALPLATVGLGVSGISDAFKAAATRGQEAAAAAKAVETAQEGVAAAQERVSAAEKNAISAAKAHERAREGVADAIKMQTERIQDLNLELKGAALDEEDALIGVERARERLQNMPSDSTALDYREAANDLKQAKQRLEEVRESNDDLRQETDQANKEGVEGSRAVRDARDAEAEAADRVAEANKGIVDALKNLEKANKNLAEAGQTTDKFAEAMNKLAPAAQEFVNAMISLGPQFTELRKMVQQKLFQGLAADVKNLALVNLPVLERGLGGIATALNNTGKQVISAFAAPDAVEKFGIVMDRVGEMVNTMAPGFFALAGAFKNLSTVGSEFLGGFATGFTEGAQGIERWTMDFDHMRDIMQTAIDRTQQIWSILKNFGGLLASVFNPAPIERILNAINGMVAGLRATAESAEGQKSLATFWDNGARALETIGPLISEIALGLVDIGGILAGFGAGIAPGVTDFISGLREGINNLRPLFEQAAPIISDLFTNLGALLPGIGIAIRDAGIAFLPLIENVSNFVKDHGQKFVDILQWLAPHLPIIAAAVLGLAGAWKVFRLAEKGIGVVSTITQLGKQTDTTKKKTVATKLLTGAINGAKAAESGFRSGMTKGVQAIKNWNIGAKIAAAATKTWAVVQGIFNAVMAANPIVLIVIGLAALGAALVLAYQKSETFRNIVNAVWEAVKTAAGIAWDWLKGIFDNIKTAFGYVGDFFGWVWENVIKPAWDGLSAGISWVWENVIKPVWDALKAALGAVGDFFEWVWEKVIKPAWDALGAGIGWVWDNIVKPVWENFKVGLQLLGDAFSWAWNNIIKPVWNALGDGIKWVWENVIKKAWDALKDALGVLERFFDNTVEAIRKIWDKIKEIAAKPIIFVVDTVINNGLLKAWNAVVGKIGLDSLKVDPINIDALKNFHRGGVMPGYSPGRDDRMIAVGGGEAIMRPEWTRAVGPGYVEGANAAARTGGVNGVRRFEGWFARGGEVREDAPPWPGGGGESNLKPAAILARRNIHLYWPEIGTIGGYRPYDQFPDHPSGLALDVMTGDPVGTEVNDWLHNQMQALALNYTIWKQFYKPAGGAGNRMEDRGSITQNHFDHIHALFNNNGVPGIQEGGVGGGGGGGGGFIRRSAAELFDAAASFVGSLIEKAVPDFMGAFKEIPLATFNSLKDAMKSKIAGVDAGDSGGSVSMGPMGAGQKHNAKEIIEAAKERSLGKEGSVIGIITGLAESGLRVLANPAVPASMGMPNEGVGNDHDSVGIFQQRQAGWGTLEQRMNPRASAGLFFNKLMTFDWRSMDPGAAAQKVQVSAYPDAYNRYLGQGRGLVAELYDSGGKLPPGVHIIQNSTGDDEIIRNAEQENRLWDFNKANKWLFEEAKFTDQVENWGISAFKEIAGGFLDPLGLSGVMDKLVDRVVEGVRTAQEEDRAREQRERGAAIEAGGSGDTKVAETVVFNGVDAMKAMDEMTRWLRQGMNPSVGRYRGEN